jgi:outer membrane biosynthesis protein TonB
VKSIRLSWSLATALLWVTAASVGLGGCGGSTEVVQSAAPAKVKWGDSDAPASEEPAGSEEPTPAAPAPAPAAQEEASPTEIDLDAPAPKAAAAPPVETEETEAEEVEAAPEAPSAADNPLAVELQKRRIAKDRKANKGKKPKSKKKAASAAPEPAAAAYTGSDPCRATSFSVPRVRAACAAGGRAAAKRVMKDAIGKATATGQTLKCGSCHANQRDYALKSNAVAELQRWLDE